MSRDDVRRRIDFSEYQPVSPLCSAEEEARREARDEFEEAGYRGTPVFDPITGTNEVYIEEEQGGCSSGGQASTEREPERQRGQSSLPIEILGSRYLSGLARYAERNGQKRLVRESYYCGQGNVYKTVDGISRSLFKKGTVYAISRHESPTLHYHVVHACPWKWYCCRCYEPPGGVRTLKTVSLSRVSLADWNAELLYLSSDGRCLQYLHCGTTFTKSFRGIKYIPDEGLSNQGTSGEMEDSHNEDESESQCTGDEDSGTTSGHVVGSSKNLPKPCNKIKSEEIEIFIMDHVTVPLDSITNSKVWQTSKYRFIDESNKELQSVIKSLRSRLNHWTYFDFVKFYDTHKPLFKALNGDVSNYYLSYQESVDVIKKLLEYQTVDYANLEDISIREAVTLFLTDLFHVVEKRIPKVNTFEIIGPPSSGKSFFMDMVADFYINVGLVENFDRHHSFPLQSAFNRRINQWNEAQCEHSKLDIAKLLLGGDPCPANIKYKDIAALARTPVLLTANKQLIPNVKAFNDRMYRYSWKAAPFLQEIKKKPNPLCIISLYDIYEVNKD